MSNLNWWKIEEEILERYSKNHSIKITDKEYPDELLVRHSKLAYRAEIILGIVMILFSFLFLIPYPEPETYIAIAIGAFFGIFVILSAKGKIQNNNYDLSNTGIRYKEKTIIWADISEIQKIRLKRRNSNLILRVLDQNGKIVFDLPLTSELNPKPNIIQEYLLYVLKNAVT